MSNPTCGVCQTTIVQPGTGRRRQFCAECADARNKASMKASQERNREKISLRGRARYEANREAIIAQTSAWAKANPDKRRVIVKKNNLVRADAKALWHQLRAFGIPIERHECAMCGTSDLLVVHHADGNNGKLGRPLNNDPENLVVLCRACHPKVHSHGRVLPVSA